MRPIVNSVPIHAPPTPPSARHCVIIVSLLVFCRAYMPLPFLNWEAAYLQWISGLSLFHKQIITAPRA